MFKWEGLRISVFIVSLQAAVNDKSAAVQVLMPMTANQGVVGLIDLLLTSTPLVVSATHWADKSDKAITAMSKSVSVSRQVGPALNVES